jgi:uncharacterized short protein YbdD (DUF466 family)
MTPSHSASLDAPPVVATRVDRKSGVRYVMQRGIALLRRIIGVPDYDAYLAFMRRRYPDCTPIDRHTFERERLSSKYTRPGTRCC